MNLESSIGKWNNLRGRNPSQSQSRLPVIVEPIGDRPKDLDDGKLFETSKRIQKLLFKTN